MHDDRVMNQGTAQVMRADSRNLPLADNSVDLVVTSPPYFALRSYQDGGKHYGGQIGDEPTPDEYVTSLLEVTAECVRVLKPSGSLWVNLGDKYQRKALLLLPQRYAIRCADELGLMVRAEMVWSKPNKYIDAKASGRVRRTHESWLHLTTTGAPFATDALREQPEVPFTERPQYKRAEQLFAEAGLTERHRDAVRSVGVIDSKGGEVRSGGSWASTAGRLAAEVRAALGSYYRELCGSGADSQGRMPGSVWEVASHPFKVPKHLGLEGHFATFPVEFPTWIVQGWSEPGMTVLDPFGGTGTTAMVAKALSRHGISVDMSADYCQVADWRTNDRGQLDKVLRVAKADQQSADQLSIFDFGGGAA